MACALFTGIISLSYFARGNHMAGWMLAFGGLVSRHLVLLVLPYVVAINGVGFAMAVILLGPGKREAVRAEFGGAPTPCNLQPAAAPSRCVCRYHVWCGVSCILPRLPSPRAACALLLPAVCAASASVTCSRLRVWRRMALVYCRTCLVRGTWPAL